jgi:hypothetical protein
MQMPLRRRRRGLARRLTWLAMASLTATALFATPGIALGHTPNVTLICQNLMVNPTQCNTGGTNHLAFSDVGTPHLTLSATDAANVESPSPLGDNWRLIVLAVVGAVGVTLRRTTAPAKRLNEQDDN